MEGGGGVGASLGRDRAEPAARRGFAPAPSLDYRCRGGLALAIKLSELLCFFACRRLHAGC